MGTVAGFLATEVVPLHNSCESLTFGYRSYVNFFSSFEQIGSKLLAHFYFADIV